MISVINVSVDVHRQQIGQQSVTESICDTQIFRIAGGVVWT